MALQYLRKCSIVVADVNGNGIDVSDFKCRFEVRRGDYQNPNTCDLRVWNLSDNTANLIQNEFSQIIVQAGYEGSYGQIFQGVIKQVRKGRIDGKDSYVDITAADGDEAYTFATMSLSMAAGTYPTDSVQALVSAMVRGSLTQQLQPPAIVPNLKNTARVRGRVYYGMARDELRDFAAAYGLSWSIQDGRITFIPLKGYLPGPVPVLSPDTGLIGVPEQTQNGIEMTTLLNPNLRIGQLVKLSSATVNLLRYGLDNQSQGRTNTTLQLQLKTNVDGQYYVMLANHVGDTRGEEWHTHLVCLSTDATITGAAPQNIIAIPADGVSAFG